MAEGEVKFYWPDWTLFGLRWVFLIGVSLAVVVAGLVNDTPVDYQELAIAFAVGAVATAIIAAIILIPPAYPALPFVVTGGDWLLAGLFLYITDGQRLLLIAIVGTLAAASLLRFGPVWGIADIIGLFVVAVGVLVYFNGTENLNYLIDDYALPGIVAAIIVGAVGAWVYVQYDKTTRVQKQLSEIATTRALQLDDMRERSRALAEMTMTLSSTLSYDRILDVTLDIGRISLKSKAKNREITVSIVMLFRSRDNALYIANSRGLNHIDQHRVLHGEEGIVAQVLKDCVPVIGKDGFDDPELRTINAFQNVRSILCIPLRARYDNFGILLFGSRAPNAFDADQLHVLSAIGVQATVALQNAVLYSNLMEERERIIESEEGMREALVHDLHDSAAQLTAAIKMKANIIKRLLERDPVEVPKELAAIEDLAQRASDEIRHVMFNLHPAAIDTKGLGAALKELADKTQKHRNQAVTVRVGADVEMYFDKSQQGAIFNLIQEAVNNACKYAQAKLIRVDVIRQNDMVVLQVADNGIGFDPNQKKEDGRDHIGMESMRTRAELLDGTLTVDTAPGRGTRIKVMLPIDTSKTRAQGEFLRAYMPETKLAVSAMSSFEEMARS